MYSFTRTRAGQSNVPSDAIFTYGRVPLKLKKLKKLPTGKSSSRQKATGFWLYANFIASFFRVALFSVPILLNCANTFLRYGLLCCTKLSSNLKPWKCPFFLTYGWPMAWIQGVKILVCYTSVSICAFFRFLEIGKLKHNSDLKPRSSFYCYVFPFIIRISFQGNPGIYRRKNFSNYYQYRVDYRTIM